jgi:hypothetical protein
LNTGWLKTKSAMLYIDIKDKRTFRKILKDGDLRYSVLPNGEIRIKRSWLDEFMEGLEVNKQDADGIVRELMRD